jgi:putative MATE family efflux protein
MVSQLLFTFYNMADTFWLGHLPLSESSGAVSGLQLDFPIIWFISSFILGFGFAGVELVAQYTGAKCHEKANYAAAQILLFLTLAGVIVAVIGYFLMPLVARLITTSTEISNVAISYMKIYVIGIPFLFISAAFQNILSAKGDNVTPMQVTLAANILNIVLDPFLIFGWWIFPRMTVVGAAIATVIAEALAGIISLYFLFRGSRGIKITLKDLKIDPEWFSQIFKIGFPAAIGNSASSFGFLVLTGLIGRTENPEVALSAYGIRDRAINVIFVVIDGIGAAIVTMVGQNLGALNIKRTEFIAKTGIKLEFVITLVESVIIFAMRNLIFEIFIPGNTAVITEGSKFLTVFIFGLPFFGLFSAVSGVFRGSGHNVEPMIGDLLRLWGLRVPLSYILGKRFGSTGIWWGMTLSNIVAGIAVYVMFTFGKWKKPVIKKGTEVVEENIVITGRE